MQGLQSQEYLEERYVMHTYGRKKVQFVRGDGMRLYDAGGREYLDFIAGIGSVSLGHCNPYVTKKIQEQAAKLVQVSNYYYIENRGELACEISDALYGSREVNLLPSEKLRWKTFFCNSGAEANEGAIKIARHFGNDELGGATTIVCAKQSFHGRTLATLSATGQAAKQEPFAPLVQGFVHVPLNDCDALEQALSKPDVCALLLEPIQGEGGVFPCTEEYMRLARELTEKRGQLLMLDEVQTGVYRTGAPFCFQYHHIVPDVVTMAKGLAGGVPIGAVAARPPYCEILQPGEHGSTFGGNPLACAAGLAVLSHCRQPGFARSVCVAGKRLQGVLMNMPYLKEVRGEGLMLALELDRDIAVRAVDCGLSRGLVLNSVSPSTLRFLPPLICTEEDCDALGERLETVLREVA